MSTIRHASVESLESRTLYSAEPITQLEATVSVKTVTAEQLNSIPLGKRSFADLTLIVPGTSKADAVGKATLKLYASKDNTLDSSDRMLTSSIRNLNVMRGSTFTQRLNFTYPASLSAGKYHLIGTLTPQFPVADSSMLWRSSRSLVNLTAPKTTAPDLSVSFGMLPAVFPYGVPNAVPFTLKNVGNTDSTKPVHLSLYSSSDKIFGNSDDRLLNSFTYSGTLRAHASANLKFHFTTPTNFVPGSYYVGAYAAPTGTQDPHPANNYTFSMLKISF